jgi:PLD-like domain
VNEVGEDKNMNRLSSLIPVIQAHAALWNKPDILTVRPGYQTKNGWPTSNPAIVVTKKSGASDPDVPKQINGTPVEIRPATEVEDFRFQDPDRYDTLAARRPELNPDAFDEWIPSEADATALPAAPAVLAAGPQQTYAPPNNIPLKAVQGKLSITCHASPDAGWPTLKQFLSKTNKRLTIGLYDFTSAHILQGIEDALTGAKTLEITLDNPVRNPTADQTDTETLQALDGQLGNQLKAAWALVRTNQVPRPWIFPTAYHIKVAVRDSEAVWLSSGNWNNSNQPNMDPVNNPQSTDQQTAKTHDRDWHVVIDNQDLAKTYEAYLKNDFEVANRAAGGIGFAAAAAADQGEMPPGFELAAVTHTWKFFAPLRLENEQMTITPLLTPDEGIYAPAMLKLIQSATTRMYIQLQYIHPSDKPDDQGLTELIDAVAAKINGGVDVRIITSQFQRSNGWLDRLQAAGIALDNVKIQNGVHNKGFVVDGKAVAIGSQNWSGEGVLRNRDASVIIENQKAAEYFEKIFLHDWDNIARQSVSAK